MKEVKTQYGISCTADFGENTWTFLIPDNYEVCAGSFAIVDKQVYDKLIEELNEYKAKELQKKIP